MGLTMTGMASPFGADASWIIAEPDAFRGAGGAVVTGLHLYMGSGVTEEETLGAQLMASAALAGKVLAALVLEAAEVDLGGGFGMPYARRGGRPAFSGLAAILTPVLDESLPGWRAGAPLVSYESGRYLTGGAGTLVCRVVDVKKSQGRTFVVLDSGAHHLGGMSALRRLPRVVPDLIPAQERGGRIADCVVTGPLCTPLDTWSDGVTLPLMCPGDLISVPNVGAYGLTASLIAFLGHPPPVEVVLDGDRIISSGRLTLGRTTLEVPGG
jgi:diaminopimelate decarboxylase